jgi:hypothetical protein
MGRGLAAILTPTEPGEARTSELRELPVELVRPNPHQPRKQFDESALLATRCRSAACCSPCSCGRSPAAPTS